MSIGKSAIKRVVNNGYSSVTTSAPDMENSSVIASPSNEVVEKLIAPIEKKTTKKQTKKSTAKLTKERKNEAFKRISFGEELPYYLL